MEVFFQELAALPLPATFFVLTAGLLRALGALFGLWGLYFILGPAAILRSVIALVISAPVIVGQADGYVALVNETQRFALLMVPLREFAIGIALGLLMSIPFFSVLGAAMLVDQYRGDFSPGIQAPEGLTVGSYGALNMVMVLFVFVEVGGFMMLVGVLYESYQILPPSVPGLSVSTSFPDALGRIIANIMAALMLFAMPVILILILLDIGINLIHRLSEQIKVPSIDFLMKNLALVLLMPVLVIGLFRMMEEAITRAPAPIQLLLEAMAP